MMEMGIPGNLFGGSTDSIPAICDLDLKRYLGRWYEIARMPQRFEDGLENVTATYNLRDDGKIEVINAGTRDGERQEARAVAWVRDDKCSGELYVSFFRPFKSKYRVIMLDNDNYRYAVVSGGNFSYLWILSREPQISDELYKELVSFASSNGFDTSRLIKVLQKTE
jgi:apolipoprotein D and lipocalin family protein